ncbi:MAG: sulfite exporter TauE/SafE family protein [Acidobacteriota bacterium]
MEETWVLAGCFGIALFISFFTSMAGVSGAFVLVPVQVSLLGITGPVVSSTNHLYNLVATPGGVLRYWQEGRMAWRVAVLLAAGGIPGAIIGVWLRIRLLTSGGAFRVFVGVILLLLGLRLVFETLRKGSAARPAPGRSRRFSCTYRALEFDGHLYPFSPALIVAISLAVGVVGGAYGVGGGAFMAPILVGVLGLPVHGVSGALLAGTFMTSAAGVGGYQLFDLANPAYHAAPDWWRGLAFGLGGLVGSYSGGRWQTYFSPRFIRGVLATAVLAVALRYLLFS